MKKIIFGLGLLISSAIAHVSVQYLILQARIQAEIAMAWAHEAGRSMPTIMGLVDPTFSSILSFFFIPAGLILCIWGMLDKDKNEMKKTVLGAGLIIIGAIMDFATIFVRQIPGRHSVLEIRWYVVALFLTGIALSIWGLYNKNKKTDTPPKD